MGLIRFAAARPVRTLVCAAIAAGAGGVVLALAGTHSPLRMPLLLLFLAVAPTAAVAGLLRGADKFARLLVAGTASIVFCGLVAVLMLAIGVRSPRAGLVVIVVFSGICLSAQMPFARRIAGARLGRRRRSGRCDFG